MGSGVPRGAASAHQFEMVRSGRPASTTLGTSGNIGIRLSVATARAVTAPCPRWAPAQRQADRKQLDFVCKQPQHRRRRTSIRNMSDLDVGDLLQALDEKMIDRSDARESRSSIFQGWFAHT